MLISRNPAYLCWRSMVARCNYPYATRYKRYGARGIKVCERWLVFENFLADVGPRPSPQHSLDRIDNDGNYAPGNVRWADALTQARNRDSKRVQLVGTRFGSLTVVSFKESIRKGTVWMCRCDCGNEKPVWRGHLISGAQKSCGCKNPVPRADKRLNEGDFQ